jgi:hypothetical protein
LLGSKLIEEWVYRGLKWLWSLFTRGDANWAQWFGRIIILEVLLLESILGHLGLLWEILGIVLWFYE